MPLSAAPRRFADRLHAEIAGTYPAALAKQVRVLIGLIAAVRGIENVRIMREVTPQIRLKVPWAEWLPAATPATVGTSSVVWVGFALIFAAGVKPRFSGAVLVVSMVAAMSLDQQAYSNHLYLLIVLVALTTLAQPQESNEAPAWPVLLFKIQIMIVYVFAALTKITSDWLDGSVLERFLGLGLVDVPNALVTGGIGKFLAIAVIVVELCIATALWFRATRAAAIIAGVLFHVAISLVMAPTVQFLIFSAEMVTGYLLFWNEPTPTLSHCAGVAPDTTEAA